MIRALIFDFDGLIVDTEGADYQSWVELYQLYGFDLSFEMYAGSVGAGVGQGTFDPYTDLDERLSGNIDWKETDAKRLRRVRALTASQPSLPGVLSYLEDGKRLGLKLGIASSSNHVWVDGHLNRLGLSSFFESVCCADDVRQTKPAPDLYLAALNSLKILAKEAIAFEDSAFGVTSAKKAGMKCVAVPNQWTAHNDFEHADLRLHALADLPLEKLLSCVNRRV
jgi:HAD superfamily hydrolase (TIGR01509 family)